VTLGSPGPDCYDLTFQAGYPLSEPAEVALEDYARELTRARAAEALRSESDPSRVRGVHVCGLTTILDGRLMTDIEDFARGLALHAGGGGLGWS
jgi:hypothetical protein